MGDTNNTKVIIRAAKRRSGSSSARTRTSAPTPPSTIITNPTRIAGIRHTLRNEAMRVMATESEKLTAHLNAACGITTGDELLSLTDKEQLALKKAFTLAYESTPDAFRIQGEIPGVQLFVSAEKTAKKQKQYSRRGPQVISTRRVNVGSSRVTSQIERVLSEASAVTETVTEIVDTKPAEVLVRTLPQNCDLSGFTAMASSRTKVDA